MSDSRYAVRSGHRGRFRCCGVLIDTLPPEAATQALLTSRHGRARRVHLCEPYLLSLALADKEFRALLNAAHINLAAAERLVRRGHKRGHRNLTGRVDASTLLLDTLSQGRAAGLRHHLCGEGAETVAALKERLEARLPGVDIVATSVLAFPIRDAEGERLAALVAERRPDIVWVGCATPFQDGFVAAYAERLGVTVVPVGGAFDALAERKPAAGTRPGWVRRALGGVQFGFGVLTDNRRTRKLDRAR